MSDRETSPTFQHACDEFLAELQHQVQFGRRSAATLAMHRLHVGYLYSAIAPTTPIAEIDEKRVYSCAVLESQGRRRTQSGEQRPNCTGTVAKRLCTLRMALQTAHKRGWIQRVPLVPQFGREYQPRREFLRTPAELSKLVAALPQHRGDWVYLMLFTGQHPSDVERMRAYVDADPFARVPWFVRRNTKNRRPVMVMSMPTPLVARLREVFEREKLAVGDPIVPAWNKDNRSRTLRRVGKQQGLLLRRATDLRHTCVSWAAHELGTLTVGVRDYLGHTSLEITNLVYAHSLPPALSDVAAALSRAAGGPRFPARKKLLRAGDNADRKKKAPSAAANSRRGS